MLCPAILPIIFTDEIKNHIKADFISMIEETAAQIMKSGRGVKAALLATEGTCTAGIYDKVFAKKGMELLKPDKAMQDVVTGVIYNVKKGIYTDYSQSLEKAVKELRKGSGTFHTRLYRTAPLF